MQRHRCVCATLLLYYDKVSAFLVCMSGMVWSTTISFAATAWVMETVRSSCLKEGIRTDCPRYLCFIIEGSAAPRKFDRAKHTSV
ncbi:hypothetical protein BKA82DRAFT_916395 [Pisolithus tinctorius]|nr:hypothetical protein BKA82DRAFT_916395 [Pisolithus tinctorius]